jgi:hypothetical protein
MGSIRITPNDWNIDTGSNAVLFDGDPYDRWSTSSQSYTAQSDGELNDGADNLFNKYGVPFGVIAMWYGGASNVPKGWCFCDGRTVTNRYGNSVTAPDLRTRFVVGVGNYYNPNDTGGSNTISIDEDTGNNSVEPTVSHNFSVSVNNHSLAVGEIPQHVHGMMHGHNEITATASDHSHTYSDKYLHDSGTGDYDNSTENSTQDGQYRTDSKTTSTASITITGSVPSGTGKVTPDAKTGEGSVNGLKNPADGHSHPSTFSGNVSLSNTTHTHSYDFSFNNRPPYYALCYIMKL